LLSDSSDGTAQNRSGVVNGEVVEIAKQKDLLFVARKAGQGSEYESGIIFGRRIKRCDIGKSGDENEPLFSASAVRGRVADDGEKPSAEGMWCTGLGKLMIGFNEGVLRDVLGGVMVAEDGPGCGMDMAFIAADKSTVSIATTGEYLAYQMLVGLQCLDFQGRHIQLDENRRCFTA